MSLKYWQKLFKYSQFSFAFLYKQICFYSFTDPLKVMMGITLMLTPKLAVTILYTHHIIMLSHIYVLILSNQTNIYISVHTPQPIFVLPFDELLFKIIITCRLFTEFKFNKFVLYSCLQNTSHPLPSTRSYFTLKYEPNSPGWHHYVPVAAIKNNCHIEVMALGIN